MATDARPVDGMENVAESIQVLTEQNKEMQMRVEQVEQEVVRQRGAIEQSAYVVASVSICLLYTSDAADE